MAFPPSCSKRRAGFTLIELLVVITIVGILAAIIFPVYGSVQDTGRKTQAVSDERGIILACMNYKADYNRLPLTPNQQLGSVHPYNSDTCYGDGKNALYPGYLLMDILRGIPDDSNKDNICNPGQTVYFAAPTVKNDKDPRHGLLRVDYNDPTPNTGYTMKAGSYVDPWGSEYVTWLDSNNDHNLNAAMLWFYPNYKQDTATTIYGPRATVQVASLVLCP